MSGCKWSQYLISYISFRKQTKKNLLQIRNFNLTIQTINGQFTILSHKTKKIKTIKRMEALLAIFGVHLLVIIWDTKEIVREINLFILWKKAKNEVLNVHLGNSIEKNLEIKKFRKLRTRRAGTKKGIKSIWAITIVKKVIKQLWIQAKDLLWLSSIA